MSIRNLLLLPFLALLGVSTAIASRTKKDETAKLEFARLNFFTDGRGMHLSPGLITSYGVLDGRAGAFSGFTKDRMSRRWGVIFENERLAGLSAVEYKGLNVGVMGCVVCHSGRAAGRYIIGLGNKNIDVVQMASDVHRIESWWKLIIPGFMKSADYRDVEDAALDFSRYLSDDRIGNLTQGLVPVSFIRGWFYRVHGRRAPIASRGQVKVPMLWGYETKRKVGQFCDGFGEGDKAGWAAAVELAAGQRHEVVRRYYPDVEKAELLFNDFLPPRFPDRIDSTLAAAGQSIFEKTCAACHGRYQKDEAGLPVFAAPKFISWDIVRTDSNRLDGNTPEFIALVRMSPLRDLIRTTELGRGYFAPRLDGIWARFPYLHNGSVPSIRALLSKASERPKYFSLHEAGEAHRFDGRALGLNRGSESEHAIFKRAKLGDRDVYDTTRVGHSNQGHEFFTDLPSESKDAILEYLKTL